MRSLGEPLVLIDSFLLSTLKWLRLGFHRSQATLLIEFTNGFQYLSSLRLFRDLELGTMRVRKTCNQFTKTVEKERHTFKHDLK